MSYSLRLFTSLAEGPVSTWCGFMLHSGELQPQECKTVDTTIRLLSRPAVYDVGRWHIEGVMEHGGNFSRYGTPRLVYTHAPVSLSQQWEDAALAAPLVEL